MENKLRRKYTLIFVCTLLGYFIGGMIYFINGGENNTAEFFAQMLGAAIGTAGSYIIIFRRDPKLKTMEKILSKDERMKVIRGEASLGTLLIALIVVIMGEVQGNFYLSFGAAIVGGLMFLLYAFAVLILIKIR